MNVCTRGKCGGPRAYNAIGIRHGLRINLVAPTLVLTGENSPELFMVWSGGWVGRWVIISDQLLVVFNI